MSEHLMKIKSQLKRKFRNSVSHDTESILFAINDSLIRLKY